MKQLEMSVSTWRTGEKKIRWEKNYPTKKAKKQKNNQKNWKKVHKNTIKRRKTCLSPK